jgi:endonuclease/exonuclease/phosphatase family metal-dependent hydrolase
VRVATWNVQWAIPASTKGGRVAAKLHDLDADVLVVTEGQLGLLPDEGHLIDAGNDWGYGEERYRRKVLAWSKRPWRELRRFDEGAAKGRVLVAVTDTDEGPIRVIAVCIPWRDAHVRSGRRDARGWEEHVECCGQLLAFRQALDAGVPTLIAGDYNQRIPRKHQPLSARPAREGCGPPWRASAPTRMPCRNAREGALGRGDRTGRGNVQPCRIVTGCRPAFATTPAHRRSDPARPPRRSVRFV